MVRLKKAKTSEEWMESAVKVVKRLRGKHTGESIRSAVEKHLGPAHHPNVYGALVAHCLRLGYLNPTGDMVRMQKPSSHGRKTPIYACS